MTPSPLTPERLRKFADDLEDAIQHDDVETILMIAHDVNSDACDTIRETNEPTNKIDETPEKPDNGCELYHRRKEDGF